MTKDEVTALFLRSLEIIHIDGDRVRFDDAFTLKDLNTIAGLCGLVAQRPEDTPMDGALVRLAAATGALLTTCVVDGPDNLEICVAWRSAVSEYLDLAEGSRAEATTQNTKEGIMTDPKTPGSQSHPLAPTPKDRAAAFRVVLALLEGDSDALKRVADEATSAAAVDRLLLAFASNMALLLTTWCSEPIEWLTRAIALELDQAQADEAGEAGQDK